jgi:triosephosphate isomerase (TIM)
MRKKYIVANWKMNPISIGDAEKLFKKVKDKALKFNNVKTIICPPFVYLGELSYLYSGSKISLGAQDSFWENKGSFTGEISPVQIKDLGADYVILGHSERRVLGETNRIVNRKVKVALSAGLNVILCVGEKERDEEGNHLHFIESEIRESLDKITIEKLSRVTIAYEPIWAIGKDEDDAMNQNKLHEMKLYILRILKEMYGTRGLETRIIYGGSAEPGNAEELIREGQVDGLLVGHESLIAESFLEIIKIANNIKS